MADTTTTSMKPTSSVRYAVGMFGTSIPVNMFKTYAAFFYVDRLGLITTPQYSLILFLYTFLDAIDNPVYGFLSDRTRSKWGRRRPWLIIARRCWCCALYCSSILRHSLPRVRRCPMCC